MPRRSAVAVRPKAGRILEPIARLLGEASGSERVRLFAESCVRNPDGSPFRFTEWQLNEIIRPLYDTLSMSGVRQFRQGLISVARKNGKSWLVSILSLYHLFADREPRARVYIAASTREQASLCFDAAAGMVEKSPLLLSLSQVQRFHKSIRVPSLDAELHTLAAEAPATLGLNPSFCILDEVAEQKNRELYDSLSTSMGARRQPLFLSVGTAGSDLHHSIAGEIYQHAKGVKKNPAVDPQFFAFIRELPEGADWTDERLWHIPNPAIDDFRDREELRAAAERAKQMVTARNSFLRFYMNLWTSTEELWLDMQKWNAAPALDFASLDGEACFGGLDIGSTQDLCAYALCFPRAKGEYALKVQCFLPSNDLDARVKRDRVRYDLFAKAGWLTLCPGPSVDLEMVLSEVEESASRHDLRMVAYDPWNAQHISQRIAAEGITVAEFRQNLATFSAPTKMFEKLVVEGKLLHGHNRLLSWMAENTSVYCDPNANIRPIKPDKRRDSRRIDGIVASIMALGACMGNNEAPYRSVYEDRGLLVI